MSDCAPSRSYRAAELSWMLLALFETGIRVRADGQCVGELRGGDVRILRFGVRRAAVRCVWQARQYRRRSARHLRQGHDISCLLTGVPAAAAKRLVSAWAAPHVTEFGFALVDQVVTELSRAGIGPMRGWTPDAARAAVRHAIHSRITPVPPAEAAEVGSPGGSSVEALRRVLPRATLVATRAHSGKDKWGPDANARPPFQ